MLCAHQTAQAQDASARTIDGGRRSRSKLRNTAHRIDKVASHLQKFVELRGPRGACEVPPQRTSRSTQSEVSGPTPAGAPPPLCSGFPTSSCPGRSLTRAGRSHQASCTAFLFFLNLVGLTRGVRALLLGWPVPDARLLVPATQVVWPATAQADGKCQLGFFWSSTQT